MPGRATRAGKAGREQNKSSAKTKKNIKSKAKPVKAKIAKTAKTKTVNTEPVKSKQRKTVLSSNPIAVMDKTENRKTIRVTHNESFDASRDSSRSITSIIDIFERDDIDDFEKKHELSQLKIDSADSNVNIDGMDVTGVTESVGPDPGTDGTSNIENNLPTFTDRLRMWESMGPNDIVKVRKADPSRSRSVKDFRTIVSSRPLSAKDMSAVSANLDSDNDDMSDNEASTVDKSGESDASNASESSDTGSEYCNDPPANTQDDMDDADDADITGDDSDSSSFDPFA